MELQNNINKTPTYTIDYNDPTNYFILNNGVFTSNNTLHGEKLGLRKRKNKVVLGNLTEERFLKLSYKYEDEQSALKQQIKQLKKIVLEEKVHEMNADGFLKIVREYENFEELSLEISQEFIDKIVVHHRENIHGETIQNVEIYYKMIGHVNLPLISKKETERLQKTFGKNQKREAA